MWIEMATWATAVLTVTVGIVAIYALLRRQSTGVLRLLAEILVGELAFIALAVARDLFHACLVLALYVGLRVMARMIQRNRRRIDVLEQDNGRE